MNFLNSTFKNSICIGVVLFIASPTIAQEHDDEEDNKTGPHGGRLLEADGFVVELTVFERLVEPQFRVWAFLDEIEIAPSDWQIGVELTRLGGNTDNPSFVSNGKFLASSPIAEPHSFDVRVTASHAGNRYRWDYESHEGRVDLSPQQVARLGIVTQVASTQSLLQQELLYGKIAPDPKLVSHITARYPGLIRSVSPELGDYVNQGDLVATVEANDSLQTYEIRAPISGTIIDSHANPGEFASDQPLLTIANYSNVWADLNVFPSEAQRIRAGQEVILRMGELSTSSTIRYLNPGEGLSPHVIARVPLANPDLIWTPGLLVEADVTVAKFDVDLAVENTALQEFLGRPVVFIQVGNSFEARPLQLGRSDRRFTEVLSGLDQGDVYVVTNSYLLKADLEKSGATHAH
ncbi:MAG: efflux RND transporter periplasmic adaptor subunit [Gammaproteobacteria bacterium]|nr:efflux RND transporter periplasmic adaptor subunit [Gammaproteobacteria bacterium]